MKPDELDTYRAHVGRKLAEHDMLSTELVKRFAAAVDQPFPGAGKPLPPMWHYAFFANDTPTAALGPDGHPPRGDFMPPVKLPRRMFAGASLRFHAPLTIGQPATKTSEIKSVDFREGKSGGLVFVRVAIRYAQSDTLCVEEEQTIVYRDDGPPIPPVMAKPDVPLPAHESREDWHPDSVALFRYSAVTFNGHRIHYDLAYVTTVEGYPGLVVHGPFTALKLCTFAGRLLGGVKTFKFRGEAPLFCDQPVRLVAQRDGGELQVKAVRCDGTVGMSATAT